MKRNASNASPNQDSKSPLDWEQGDPVWDLLEQASDQKADAFFARNVIRETRQLKSPSLGSRIISLFASRKVVLAAAACLGIVVGYQIWPMIPTETTTNPTPEIVESSPEQESSSNLSELVIEETILAAADDPTILTRDELVAVLGL